MRSILVAGLFAVAVLAVPAGASAWSPADCAEWNETHSTPHPDCQPPPPDVTVCANGETVTVPESQVPEGATPGECQPVVPSPPPTAVTPPPETPPEVVVPPPVVDVPPDVTVDTGSPNEVQGKEQQKPAPVPKQQQTVETLPFSGLELVWVAALGVGMLAVGAGARRFFA